MVSSNLIITQTGLSSQPKIRQKSISRLEKAPLRSNSLAPCPLHAHKNYAQINFGRLTLEHKSWGAAVDEVSKNVNFKLFTWPDVKKVFVQVKDATKNGYTPMWEEGFFKTHFHETTKEVEGLLPEAGTKIFELANKGKGVFEQLVKAKDVKHGQEYRFIIVKADNTIECVKDPYAKKQTHVNGWSEIHDHSTFNWSNVEKLDEEKSDTEKIDIEKNWQEGKDKRRLSRQHNEDGLLNPENLRIVEVHIGTMTKEGDWEAAKKELENIAKAKYNAIELMPQNGIPGTYGWGYDVADPHATKDPEKLKEFIYYAHKNGLNVIMDYVPNHMGPEGNHLARTGPYMSGYDGEHGAKFNYEGKDSEYTKDYMVNTILDWMRDYHVDGGRGDMTKFMSSDYAQKGRSIEVHSHFPKRILIDEDGRPNPDGPGDDPRITRPLHYHEEHFVDENAHAKYVEEAVIPNKIDLNNLGADYQYGYSGQKDILATVLGISYKNHSPNIRNFYEALRTERVLHVGETHDDPMNEDAFGIITKISAVHLDLYNPTKIDFKNPDSDHTLGHRANNLARKIVESVVTGDADKMSAQEWEELQRKNYFTQPVSLQSAKEKIEVGIQRKKLHDAALSLARGPQMKFRHKATFAPFHFFRNLENPKDVENMYKQKGYRPDNTYEPSKIPSLLGNEYWSKKLEGIDKMNAKLNELADSIPALSNAGQYKYSNDFFHEGSGIVGIHRSDDKGSEIFAVVNTGYGSWGNKGYGMDMPQGKWKQVFNSDSKEFEGSGNFENDEVYGGKPNISIPSSGVVIFKRVG